MVRKSAVVAVVTLLVVGAAACQAHHSDGYWDYYPTTVSGRYTALVGQFGGDEADDIVWYGPGSTPDSLWLGRSGTRSFLRRNLSVNGTYRPVVGDFAGDDHDDIFWYGVGSAPDHLWVSNGDGTFRSMSAKIAGTYTLYRLRDYRPDHKDDLLVHNTSSANSYLWHFRDDGSGVHYSRTAYRVGYMRPVVGDWNGDGIEDLFLHAPGAADDWAWLMADDGSWTSRTYHVSGTYKPYVVWQNPNDGIFWWGGEYGKEAYWWSTGTDFVSKPVRSVDGTGTITPYPFAADLISGPYVYDGAFVGDEDGGDYYALAPDGHEKTTEQPLVGDFDADGLYDIFWYGAGSQADEVWYSEPAPGGAARRAPVLGGPSHHVGQPGPGSGASSPGA